MWVFWVDLDPPMGVSATCGGCRNAPICLRNVQKTLVQGTLIVAEILISPSPCICSTWPGFWVPVLSPLGCQHLPSGLKYSYVSQKLLKKLVHGALIEAEILTLPPQMYLLNLAKFLGTSALSAGVSTPPKWSRNVPMCLRNLQKHGAWGPNRS